MIGSVARRAVTVLRSSLPSHATSSGSMESQRLWQYQVRHLNIHEYQLVLKSQVLAGGRGLGTFKNGLKGGVHIVRVEEPETLADRTQHMYLCTKAVGQEFKSEGSRTRCSPEVQDLHKKMTDEIEKKRMVPTSLLRALLEHCNIPEDVELAFETLHRFRIYRSSKARVKLNFNENISLLVVSASLRTRAYDSGLKALWKHNVYGLSPSLEAAHLFLSHAKLEKDLDLMQKAFDTMVENSLMPTTQTADIVIRLCKDKGDLRLMFKLASEFRKNGVKLSSSVHDILISTAANFGRIKKIFKAKRWRKRAGLEHTIASVFSLAKAHVLLGQPQEAVELISTHCQDPAKVNRYLAMMVRVWPLELVSKKEKMQQEEAFLKLKENMVTMVDALSEKYSNLSIDVAKDFGKGKVSLNRDDAIYEVPQLTAVF